MHTNITIENITEKYVPLHISYKGNNTILYVARINNSIIVNINSLKIPGYGIARWSRTKSVSDQIGYFNKTYNHIQAIYTDKSKRCWIIHDLIENYFTPVFFKMGHQKLYLIYS